MVMIPGAAGSPATFASGIVGASAAASALNVGELVRSFVNAVPVTVTANVWTDLTSITLTTGVWEITGFGHINNVVASGFTNCFLGVGTVAGNTNPGTFTENTVGNMVAPTAVMGQTVVIPPYPVTVSGSVIHYLKTFVNVGSSGFQWFTYKLQAKRLP